MKTSRNIRAAVLPTVLVTASMMLLSVLALLALWDADYLFFSRMRHLQAQRAYLGSAFALYAHDSLLLSRLGSDSSLLLFDSLPASRVRLGVRAWGLYELVTAIAQDTSMASVRLLGQQRASRYDGTLYYPDRVSSLSLTGNSVLEGRLLLPAHGIQYGQMRSVFFTGEPVDPSCIGFSGKDLPPVAAIARRRVDGLLRTDDPCTVSAAGADSLCRSFRNPQPIRLWLGAEARLSGAVFCGHIALHAGALSIDSGCRLRDVVVVARTIRIGDGFRGSAQFFASDSLIVGRRVELQYPSGLFLRGDRAQRYAEVGARSRVDGYVIVDGSGEPDIRKANYRQGASAVVRGLLYVDGAAQVQGVVSGCAYLNLSAYYSAEGYYRDMLYNLAVIENPAYAFPLWMQAPYRRKEAACVD